MHLIWGSSHPHCLYCFQRKVAKIEECTDCNEESVWDTPSYSTNKIVLDRTVITTGDLFQFWDSITEHSIPYKCLDERKMKVQLGSTCHGDTPFDVVIPGHTMEMMEDFESRVWRSSPGPKLLQKGLGPVLDRSGPVFYPYLIGVVTSHDWALNLVIIPLNPVITSSNPW